MRTEKFQSFKYFLNDFKNNKFKSLESFSSFERFENYLLNLLRNGPIQDFLKKKK